jgi:hypothetical protein
MPRTQHTFCPTEEFYTAATRSSPIIGWTDGVSNLASAAFALVSLLQNVHEGIQVQANTRTGVSPACLEIVTRKPCLEVLKRS